MLVMGPYFKVHVRKERSVSLNDKLSRRRKASRKQIPDDKLAVMDRATEELALSGITQACLKEGDPASDFILPNAWVAGKRCPLPDWKDLQIAQAAILYRM